MIIETSGNLVDNGWFAGQVADGTGDGTGLTVVVPVNCLPVPAWVVAALSRATVVRNFPAGDFTVLPSVTGVPMFTVVEKDSPNSISWPEMVLPSLKLSLYVPLCIEQGTAIVTGNVELGIRAGGHFGPRFSIRTS
jgi:hypothetical protein